MFNSGKIYKTQKTEDEAAKLKLNITTTEYFLSIGGIALGRGTIIPITSRNVWLIYAGRIIAKHGIGQTTTIAPLYLSEVAQKAIRGIVLASSLVLCALSWHTWPIVHYVHPNPINNR